MWTSVLWRKQSKKEGQKVWEKQDFCRKSTQQFEEAQEKAVSTA
jgi:hypothetical protein